MLRGGSLEWVGFSEEGQLLTWSDEGVASALSLATGWWTPVLNTKSLPDGEFLRRMWIVGFIDQEMLAIALPDGYEQPTPKMKQLTRRLKLQVPVIPADPRAQEPSQLPAVDAELLTKQLHVDHERYRRTHWERLKDMRTDEDPERHLSASIKDDKALTSLRKE